MSSIPGLGRFLEGGHGNSLGYSCLEVIPWTKEPGGLQCTGSQIGRAEHLSTTSISFKTLSKVQSHSKIPGSLLQYMNLWGHNSSHTRCCLFLLWDKDKDGYQVCGTKTLLDIKEAVYAVACDRCPL